MNITETAEEAQRRANEKQKLQFKIKELEDQKSSMQDSIVNMESKLATVRSFVAASTTSHNQQIYQNDPQPSI